MCLTLKTCMHIITAQENTWACHTAGTHTKHTQTDKINRRRGCRLSCNREKVKERRDGLQRRVYTYRNYSHYHWCQRLPALEGQDRSESTNTSTHRTYTHKHSFHKMSHIQPVNIFSSVDTFVRPRITDGIR